MKILKWIFPNFDKKASVSHKQAHVAAREQNDLINQSFDKEVAELSTYIEKEKEKDFVEDMEALIKDYGYTKEFAVFLLGSHKIIVTVCDTNGKPVCGLKPEDFTITSGSIIE
ncbi:MAG: hypothetical protein WC389_22775 [Lutibacter sp.]|jgi:hypothetical protein